MKINNGRDFEVSIEITPLNEHFEPVHQSTIIASATCVSNPDELIHLGSNFLSKLPDSDNLTSWR